MTTKMKSQPSLVESRESAHQKIQERIEIGEQLRNHQIGSEEEYEKAEWDFINWSKYNIILLSKLFDSSSIAHQYKDVQDPDSSSGYLSLDGRIYCHRKDLKDKIYFLADILDQLDLFGELSDPHPRSSGSIGTNIFIGHGHSSNWRELNDFISEGLKLPYDEFNRVPVAGVTNVARLATMLNQARIAFLVMTAEDEQAGGALRARENVVHEAGLFQGKLGFEKAIILLEEGCEEFSNIPKTTRR